MGDARRERLGQHPALWISTGVRSGLVRDRALRNGAWVTSAPSTDEWYQKRYRFLVAMNLRLPEELACALRELSEETGRSQQELAREALEEYVRDFPLRAYPKEVRDLVTPAARPRKTMDPEVMEVLRTIGRDRLLAGLDDVRSDRV